MSERSSVPEDEWKKFSAQNEADVEAERDKIRKKTLPHPNWRRAGMKPDGKELSDEEIRAEVEAESRLLEHGVTPEMRANEELLNRVEAGEITYEELDQQVLKTYQETPLSERNWRRDAGFSRLPESEAGQELKAEAIRDFKALAETLRLMEEKGLSDPQLRYALDRLAEQLKIHSDVL